MLLYFQKGNYWTQDVSCLTESPLSEVSCLRITLKLVSNQATAGFQTNCDVAVSCS